MYVPCIGGLPGVVLDGSMYAIARKLQPFARTEVFPWFKWKEARDRMIAAARKGELVAGVGHSYGCLELHKISIDLMKLNLPIEYIAGIDPTATPPGYGPMPIDANVNYVDEFWASFGWPAIARLRSPSGQAGGKFIYPYGTRHKVRKYRSGHIALAGKKEVQDLIVEKVKEIAHGE